MRTRTLVPLALAAALLLSACSGDDGSSGAGDTAAPATTAAATTGATTTAGSDTSAAGTTAAGDEQALVDSLLIEVQDLTPGWAAVTGTDDGEPSPLEVCYPEGGALQQEPVAEARSDDFVLGDTTVSQRAAIEQDAETVQAQLAEMTAPSMQDCLARTMESALGDQLPEGVAVGEVTIGALDGLVPQDGFAYLVTLTLTADGQEQPVALAYVGGSKGRAHSSVTVAFTGGDVDEELVAEVWAVVDAKLQAADV